jgi:hypothetical protein
VAATSNPDVAATSESGVAATSKPGVAATATTATTMGAAATTAAAMAATATTAPAARELHAAAKVFSIEEIERGQTDVGHFLFAKKEALIGRVVVRLRDVGSGRRGCGCTANQRKTQSGGTQHFHGGGFA